MSEEQKQKNTAAPEAGNGSGQWRNRRRHRGGRHHGGDRKQPPQGPAQERQPQEQAQKAAPVQSNQNQQNKNNQNGNRHGRNRRRGRGNKEKNRGIADLYGQPTQAETLSMEELRAQIVLQAADGTKPEAPSTAAAPRSELSFVTSAPVQSEPLAKAAPEELPEIEEFPLDSIPSVLSSPAIPPEDRVQIIGVRFRSTGKTYYFDPKGKQVRQGDFVVVDTARGPEFGEVSFPNRTISKEDLQAPLRPLLRIASQEDIDVNAENRAREKDAAEIFRKKVEEHGLSMKLIDVQFAFDNSKLLFYFTSEGRVDFRDLVKDLAGVFHTRIELRQIGIRDEAKLLGGLGACGRPLCCASFLSDFVQVSIKMAKEQGLSLNSAKISGTCGRLMCCLRYETESYAQELKLTPPVGSTVKTADGIGEVVANNPIAGTVRVRLTDTEAFKQYKREETIVLSKGKRRADEEPVAETADNDDAEE